jgi:KaiC/GvpD/RAD55 family RecA-like ATPase
MNTNEKSMLFTFEEDAAQIARHAFQFGYYIADAVKNGRLYLYNIKTICVEEILERIIEIRPKRIVIDSVAALYNEIDRQSGWYHLVTELKKENIACIMITRSCSNGKTSIFENRADGVLCFGKELDNGRWKRHILIKKMRATPLEIVKLPFKIIDKGIVIDESKP